MRRKKLIALKKMVKCKGVTLASKDFIIRPYNQHRQWPMNIHFVQQPVPTMFSELALGCFKIGNKGLKNSLGDFKPSVCLFFVCLFGKYMFL